MKLAPFVGLIVAVLVVCAVSSSAAVDPPIKLELVENAEIWDGAYDNSFTGMVRFKDKWYICLREALKTSSRGKITSHSVIGDGKARVIRSDGVGESINDWQWKSVAYLDYEAPGHDNWDVRDPQLTVTPDGRLMLNGAAAPLDAPRERQSIVWFSKNGTDWSDGPHKIGEYNWWMWQVAWHPDGSLYGIAYGDTTSTLDLMTTRLYRSAFPAKTQSGLDFKVHVKKLTSKSTEPALLFRRDGLAVSLVRDHKSWTSGDYSHLIGVAKGDYTDWTFHKRTGVIVGGPSLFELPDGTIIAATRIINKSGHLPRRSRTRLCWLDPDACKMVQLLTLPGGRPGEGGTGYPGIVWHDGHLWVSYYSGNAGRTKIYFAKIRVKPATSRAVLSGTVTYQGEPVKEGVIRFIPIKGTEGPSWGAHIIDGQYKAAGKGGVPVGTHKVEILAYHTKPRPARPADSPQSGFELDAPAPREQYVPEKFNTATVLEITIPPGSGKVVENFNLTD